MREAVAFRRPPENSFAVHRAHRPHRCTAARLRSADSVVAAQRATWFAQQLDPAVPISVAHYVELHGDLDIDLLRRETIAVAREFQSPFLKVVEVDGRPMQYVDHATDTSIAFIDFRGEDDPVAAAHEWMDRDYQAPLDLDVDRLFETSILCVGESHYLWYSRIHHVALDGYGAMTLINRICLLYTSPSPRD